jgi:hypothetical protein
MKKYYVAILLPKMRFRRIAFFDKDIVEEQLEPSAWGRKASKSGDYRPFNVEVQQLGFTEVSP